jgi:hypothetical protein
MEWSQILDWLIYVVTTLISLIKFKSHGFLFKMIGIDSVLSAVNFFKAFIENTDMTESVILKSSKKLYTSSIVERYVYYGCANIFYTTACNFFWLGDIKILYGGLIITCIPPILNKITNSNIFVKHVRKRKERMIKISASKQLVSLIKFSADSYLDKTVDIDHKELIPLFDNDNYETTLVYMWDMFQTSLLILVTCYIKRYSTTFYYKLTKYVYKYKTGNSLKSFNEETAKETLIKIIDNKKWSELFKPDIYKAVFHLYYSQEDQPDIFRKIIVKLNYKLGQVFAIWTISSLYKSILIAPVVTLILTFYKDRRVSLKTAGSMIITSLIGWYSNNTFVTSLSCQFVEPLLFNKVVYTTGVYLVKETQIKIKELFIRNAEYNTLISVSTLMMISFKLLDIYRVKEDQHIFLISTSVTPGIMCHNSIKKLIIFCLLILGGYSSSFNPIHIIHNSVVMYISIEALTSIIDRVKRENPERVVIQDLSEDQFIKEISVEHHVLSKSYNVIKGYCD